METQMGKCCRGSVVFAALVMGAAMPVLAQVPTPISVLGHNPGDDFYLANYEEEIGYFHALAAHSDRIKMFKAGKTSWRRSSRLNRRATKKLAR